MNIIRHRTFWLIASVVVGMSLAVGAVASSQARTSAVSGNGKAVDSVSALSKNRAASDQLPAAASGLVALGKPNGVPDALFEGAWQTNRSHLLLAAVGRSGAQVYAVPTSRGDVCTAIVIPPSKAAGGCVDEFSTVSPVNVTVLDPDEVDAGSPVIVAGVAPDNVRSVRVLVDGDTHQAGLRNNAFGYQLADSKSYPDAVVVGYADGTTRTIDVLDPRTAMRRCASGNC